MCGQTYGWHVKVRSSTPRSNYIPIETLCLGLKPFNVSSMIYLYLLWFVVFVLKILFIRVSHLWRCSYSIVEKSYLISYSPVSLASLLYAPPARTFFLLISHSTSWSCQELLLTSRKYTGYPKENNSLI